MDPTYYNHRRLLMIILQSRQIAQRCCEGWARTTLTLPCEFTKYILSLPAAELEAVLCIWPEYVHLTLTNTIQHIALDHEHGISI